MDKLASTAADAAIRVKPLVMVMVCLRKNQTLQYGVDRRPIEANKPLFFNTSGPYFRICSMSPHVLNTLKMFYYHPTIIKLALPPAAAVLTLVETSRSNGVAEYRPPCSMSSVPNP